MTGTKSATEQRKEEIQQQVERLRNSLASKSRKDFTSDFRHRSWLENTRRLIDELLDEFSRLEEPGEYEELPTAVVADELGLPLKQIRRLIKLGEIEAAGRPTHERVGRGELERLAALGPEELLKLAGADADEIFAEAISSLRAGDLASTAVAYRRLKARQTCVGTHALAVEITLKLARGKYEEADRVLQFVLREKFEARAEIGGYLAQFIWGVFFVSPEARSVILRLIKPLLPAMRLDVSDEQGPDELQLRAMYITSVLGDLIRGHCIALARCRSRALHQVLMNGIFTALHAEAHAETESHSLSFVICAKQQMPRFWEPATLPENFLEE